MRTLAAARFSWITKLLTWMTTVHPSIHHQKKSRMGNAWNRGTSNAASNEVRRDSTACSADALAPPLLVTFSARRPSDWLFGTEMPLALRCLCSRAPIRIPLIRCAPSLLPPLLLPFLLLPWLQSFVWLPLVCPHGRVQRVAPVLCTSLHWSGVFPSA